MRLVLTFLLLLSLCGQAEARSKRSDRLKPEDIAESSHPKLVKTIRVIGEPLPYAPSGVTENQLHYQSPSDIYDDVPPFNGRK